MRLIFFFFLIIIASSCHNDIKGYYGQKELYRAEETIENAVEGDSIFCLYDTGIPQSLITQPLYTAPCVERGEVVEPGTAAALTKNMECTPLYTPAYAGFVIYKIKAEGEKNRWVSLPAVLPENVSHTDGLTGHWKMVHTYGAIPTKIIVVYPN